MPFGLDAHRVKQGAAVARVDVDVPNQLEKDLGSG